MQLWSCQYAASEFMRCGGWYLVDLKKDLADWLRRVMWLGLQLIVRRRRRGILTRLILDRNWGNQWWRTFELSIHQREIYGLGSGRMRLLYSVQPWHEVVFFEQFVGLVRWYLKYQYHYVHKLLRSWVASRVPKIQRELLQIYLRLSAEALSCVHFEFYRFLWMLNPRNFWRLSSFWLIHRELLSLLYFFNLASLIGEKVYA